MNARYIYQPPLGGSGLKKREPQCMYYSLCIAVSWMYFGSPIVSLHRLLKYVAYCGFAVHKTKKYRLIPFLQIFGDPFINI